VAVEWKCETRVGGCGSAGAEGREEEEDERRDDDDVAWRAATREETAGKTRTDFFSLFSKENPGRRGYVRPWAEAKLPNHPSPDSDGANQTCLPDSDGDM
jgi:hypothetical protein